MSAFRYSTDDQKNIQQHFKRLGKCYAFEPCLRVLERSASWYLDLYAWDKALPDRESLEKNHHDELESIKLAQEILIRQCGPSIHPRTIRKSMVEDEETDAAVVGEIAVLIKKFQREEIAGIQFVLEMGVRALDELVAFYNQGSPEARWIKDGKKGGYRQRRIFIKDVASVWAGLNGCDLGQCTISATPGSPMLEFIRAWLDPLIAVTGDPDGDKTIMKIVNEIKCDHLQLREAAQ